MKIKDIKGSLHLRARPITCCIVIEDLVKMAVKVCKDVMGTDAYSIYLTKIKTTIANKLREFPSVTIPELLNVMEDNNNT
jgi:hypothetical protein